MGLITIQLFRGGESLEMVLQQIDQKSEIHSDTE